MCPGLEDIQLTKRDDGSWVDIHNDEELMAVKLDGKNAITTELLDAEPDTL